MKKLWKNNRVLVLLLGILLICFIAIVVVAISFMKPTGEDPRLVDMDKHQISKKFQDSYKEKILDSENVVKAEMTVNNKSRVIYITINFDDEAQLEAAKEVATNSLELFEKKNLEYYEINFIIKSDNPEYEDNYKALEKQFEDAEITQEEFDEEASKPENRQYRFIAIGAKNLNVDHVSWTNNGAKNEKK